jgi:hypothetical protein
MEQLSPMAQNSSVLQVGEGLYDSSRYPLVPSFRVLDERRQRPLHVWPEVPVTRPIIHARLF